MDYKNTLLMPNTKFEMRGKLPTKEPGYQNRWKKQRSCCMTGRRMPTATSIWATR